MNKKDLFIGFVLGLFAATFGAFLFVIVFTDYSFFYGVQIMKANKSLGKLITLGAVLNLVMFFILLKQQKELMARGVVLATITLAILTIFV